MKNSIFETALKVAQATIGLELQPMAPLSCEEYGAKEFTDKSGVITVCVGCEVVYKHGYRFLPKTDMFNSQNVVGIFICEKAPYGKQVGYIPLETNGYDFWKGLLENKIKITRQIIEEYLFKD